jgi:hypothetical protein
MHTLLTPQAFGLLLVWTISQAVAQIPAVSLCNTGLTPRLLPPASCSSSPLVFPINPPEGGPIVDGNWELATPYPSVPPTQHPPNPCFVTPEYTPVPVNSAIPDWFNPYDGVSQWIGPSGRNVPPGWFIYRTSFWVPAAQPRSNGYTLRVAGQFMADDWVRFIVIRNQAGPLSTCRLGAVLYPGLQYFSWNAFSATADVLPFTYGYIYFVVYNRSSAPNPTGLRVSFIGSTFTPL